MGFAEYSASKSHRKLPRRASISLSLSPSLSLSYRARNGNTIKSSAISKSARALPRSAYSELEADGTRLRAYRRWNTWSKTHCVAPRARGNPRRDCEREGRRGEEQAGGSGSLSLAQSLQSIQLPSSPPPRRVFPTSRMRWKETKRERERECEKENDGSTC